MHDFGLQFHHVGLATASPEVSLKFLRGLGYGFGPAMHDSEQNVNLVLCTHAQLPSMEVVSPTDTPGPLDAIVGTGGESFYHVCYETTELTLSLAAFKSAGHRVVCVVPRKPAVLFGGRHISYYRVRGFGLIELLET